MKTIRAIVRNGNLKALDPIDLPEETPVTVALIEANDVPAEGIAKLAQAGGAFEFLNDPREDLYSDLDGEAV